MSSFASWAFHPQRSREERFGAELLIENSIHLWQRKHGIKANTNFEAERLRKKERALNPAYEPEFKRVDAERIEEVLDGLVELDLGSYGDDRPLRDLSLVQFCPTLESLTVRNSEINDWSVLPVLTGLRVLHVTDEVGRDFRSIAQLTKLQVLHLTPRTPWPDLTGFERLTELQEFDFLGNVLALTVIPHLSALRAATFHQWVGFNVPLRRLSDLPAMPQLRWFHLENTCDLAGIERSPLLLNLEVYGYFDDLAPLTALKQLTHLMVSSDGYKTVVPLAQLSELRRVVIRREEPQDYTPLAEISRLHEITVEVCPIRLAEVATLNSVLAPWSEEFGVEPSRALKPLRLLIREFKERDADLTGHNRDWGDDKGMAASEAQWFAREVNRRLTRLLGKGWGRVNDRFASLSDPGSEHVRIIRRQDIDRLREIVESLRGLLAETRYPWSFTVVVDSLVEYERELEEIQEAESGEKEFDAESERQEWEYRQEKERERRDYLEREYRYRLQQEQGLPTRPEDFVPPPPPDNEDAVTAGYSPPEAPDYDLGTELNLYATLTESAFYIRKEDRGLAELLLEIRSED